MTIHEATAATKIRESLESEVAALLAVADTLGLIETEVDQRELRQIARKILEATDNLQTLEASLLAK